MRLPRSMMLMKVLPKASPRSWVCRLRMTSNKLLSSPSVIITVVTDDKAMKQIFAGGLLSRSRGKLFINCATVSPEVHVWVEAKAEKAGAQTLEGCMASSITQARQGSLYLMLGGKPEAFERAKPILEKLSSSMSTSGRPAKRRKSKRSSTW